MKRKKLNHPFGENYPNIPMLNIEPCDADMILDEKEDEWEEKRFEKKFGKD